MILLGSSFQLKVLADTAAPTFYYVNPDSLRPDRKTNQHRPMWSMDGKYLAVIEWREQTVVAVIYQVDSLGALTLVERIEVPEAQKTSIGDWMGGLGLSAEDTSNFFAWTHAQTTPTFVYLQSGPTGYDLKIKSLWKPDPRNLTDDSETELMPQLSPDDSMLCYVKAGDICLKKSSKGWSETNLTSIPEINLTQDPEDPDLYPFWVGNTIYVSKNKGGSPPFSYNIFRLDLSSSSITKLSYLTIDNQVHELVPTIVGNQLVFYGIDRGSMTHHVYVVNLPLQGGVPIENISQEISLPKSRIRRLDTESVGVLPAMFIQQAVSPDGKLFAYVRNEIPYYPIEIVEVATGKKVISNIYVRHPIEGETGRPLMPVVGKVKGSWDGSTYFQYSQLAWNPKKLYQLAFVGRNPITSLTDVGVIDLTEALTNPLRRNLMATIFIRPLSTIDKGRISRGDAKPFLGSPYGLSVQAGELNRLYESYWKENQDCGKQPDWDENQFKNDMLNEASSNLKTCECSYLMIKVVNKDCNVSVTWRSM